MIRFVLIRPGATDFDDQGRIKGNLNIPLNSKGTSDVVQTAQQLITLSIDHLYTSPCQAAAETADALAMALALKAKRIDRFANLNHGLWQGKLIDEVRLKQPKVYRTWQEHPETMCPPGGETLKAARTRVHEALQKLMKKHASGVVALVVPEPVFSLIKCELGQADLGDLWKAECEYGSYEIVEFDPQQSVSAARQ